MNSRVYLFLSGVLVYGLVMGYLACLSVQGLKKLKDHQDDHVSRVDRFLVKHSRSLRLVK